MSFHFNHKKVIEKEYKLRMNTVSVINQIKSSIKYQKMSPEMFNKLWK